MNDIKPVASMYVNYMGECEEITYGWGPADATLEMQPLYPASALAEARRAALTEAADLCDERSTEISKWRGYSMSADAVSDCADAIRALIEKGE